MILGETKSQFAQNRSYRNKAWKRSLTNLEITFLPHFHYHLVALNFQTNGQMMDINKGMFQLNGGCGYVLKPEFMLKGNNLPSRGLPAQSKQ